MIINIRGTGGAGKSTIVRKAMEEYEMIPTFVEGRRQPIGYLGIHNKSCDPIFPMLYVPGHYETPCGGCDTIKTPAEVFETVRREAEKGHDVLFEGIICQDDVTRTVELKKFGLLVIFLDVPIADCLAGIQARRDTRGDERPLNPKNTEARAERLKRIYSRLKDAGVPVIKLSREAALEKVLRRLDRSDPWMKEEINAIGTV